MFNRTEYSSLQSPGRDCFAAWPAQEREQRSSAAHYLETAGYLTRMRAKHVDYVSWYTVTRGGRTRLTFSNQVTD